jgi:hypothetical protein
MEKWMIADIFIKDFIGFIKKHAFLSSKFVLACKFIKFRNKVIT